MNMLKIMFTFFFAVCSSDFCSSGAIAFDTCTNCKHEHDQDECKLACCCRGCSTTKKCNELATQMNAMINYNKNDIYIKNISEQVLDICRRYQNPDWEDHGNIFPIHCYEKNYLNCNNFCGVCNTDIICNKVRNVVADITETYEKTSHNYKIADDILKFCSGYSSNFSICYSFFFIIVSALI